METYHPSSSSVVFSSETRLWIGFPVWREWKHSADVYNPNWITFLWYAFPFEGNGNWPAAPTIPRRSSSDLWYAFPLEGNGNCFIPVASSVCKFNLVIRFPVGREWKQDTPSNIVIISVWLVIHFPVWREWKLTLSLSPCIASLTWDTLSRLKGMETRCLLRLSFNVHFFGSAFPFEGNGNALPIWRTAVAQPFRLCFFVFGLDQTRSDREWVKIDEKFNEMLDKSFFECPTESDLPEARQALGCKVATLPSCH